MAWRVSYFITLQSQRLVGWSENFWNSRTSLNDAIAAAETFLPLLNSATQNPCYIPYYRISDVTPGSFRNVYVKETGAAAEPATSQALASDFPTTKVLIVLRSADNFQTRQWKGGVPDNCIVDGGYFKPTGPYQSRLNAMFKGLKDHGFSIRVQDRTIAKRIVEAIDPATGIVTITAHGYVLGDRIRIQRAKGLLQANAVWQVAPVAGPDGVNKFTLIGWVVPTVPVVYQGGGLSQKLAFLYKAIEFDTSLPRTSGATRSTKHNVGRPFGELTGRRRTRRKIQGGQLVVSSKS